MIVHPANVQDRDGAPALLESARGLVPWLRHVFADGGYAGDKLKNALTEQGEWTIEVTIAPGHPLPPAERLDGVAVRYVHGERPAPL